MFPVLTLWLALFAPQGTTPPPTPPQATQPAPEPPPSPTNPSTAPQTPPANLCSGREMTPPRVIAQTEPMFAKNEQRPGFHVLAIVNLIVDTNGMPENVHILRSAAANVKPKQRADALAWDGKAIEAVKTYRFRPATCKGTPVKVELNVEVNFDPGPRLF